VVISAPVRLSVPGSSSMPQRDAPWPALPAYYADESAGCSSADLPC